MTLVRSAVMVRRRFLASMAVLGVPVVAPALARAEDLRAPQGARRSRGALDAPRVAGFPQHDPSRVQAVVGSSHGNLEVVRQLVTEQPALAKSAWDWGFGDWETALGAASHTGRREIAAFLIAHGAHPTVFSAAMLGDVDTVRAFLTADPSLYRMHGPHGISLLAHARAGGAQAVSVLDYLTTNFGASEELAGFPGDAEVEARYGGRYRFQGELPTEIGVAVRNGFLLVGAGEQPNSRVSRVEEHTFHPMGAPSVRLRFDVVDGRAQALTVMDGPLTITGARAAG